MATDQSLESFLQQADEFQRLSPFRIKFKDESWEMQALSVLVAPFCPTFLTRFTTVLGSTIYFPNRNFIKANPQQALRTLAHEMVHLQDAARWSFPVMMLGYLFPQILAAGVLLFPWLGWWALLFLAFLAPIPAPFRAYFEARAYAIDILTAPRKHRLSTIDWAATQFSAWDYYLMQPDAAAARASLLDWVEKADQGEAKDLMRVLLVYECLVDIS